MKNSRSRASGRPTLAEVAERAGVSPITASRALRAIKSVDPDMAARVHEAAKAVGYRPNPAARTLASAQSRSVLVVIPALSNFLFIETLEAIEEVLRPLGFEILIGNFYYDPAKEEELLASYMAHQPCGILLTGMRQTEAAKTMLGESRIPCVYMMETDPTARVVSVGFSQQDAGAAVARHLIDRGRTNLAFIGAQLDDRVMQRRHGFVQSLESAGCGPVVERLDPSPSSIALGASLFRQVMEQYPQIDGLFFCNDDLAFGGIYEAQRRGIAVPDRVAIVGFNDLPGAAEIVPSLTTVKTPRAAVGRKAALDLVRLMGGGDVTVPTTDLGFALVARDSS